MCVNYCFFTMSSIVCNIFWFIVKRCYYFLGVPSCVPFWPISEAKAKHTLFIASHRLVPNSKETSTDWTNQFTSWHIVQLVHINMFMILIIIGLLNILICFLPIYTSRNQNAISCNFKQYNQSIISGNVSENMNWHVYPDHTKALAVLVMTEQSLRPFNKPLETIISCVILSSDNILVIKGLLVFPMQLQPASNPVMTEMTQLLSSVYNSYIHFSSISQLLGPVSLRFVMSYWFLHKNASNLFELLYYFLLYKIIFVKRFCLLYLRLFQYIITMYKDKSKSKISKGNSSPWHRTYTII